MAEQKHWLSAGKPLPALILFFGNFLVINGTINAMQRVEFQYLNNTEIRTFPNLASGLLMSIPGIIMIVFGFLLFYGRIKLSSTELMVRYSRLFEVVLGIVFLAIVFLGLSSSVPWLFFSPFGLIWAGHIINGIVGLYISKMELMVKCSKLFGVITVLGIIFLAFFFTTIYWIVTDAEILYLLPTPLMNAFVWFFLLGGPPIFLTVGILGIARRYLKNSQSLFTLLVLFTIIVIPLCIFATFCYWWVGLEVGL